VTWCTIAAEAEPPLCASRADSRVTVVCQLPHVTWWQASRRSVMKRSSTRACMASTCNRHRRPQQVTAHHTTSTVESHWLG
jgi:hypothetical protein